MPLTRLTLPVLGMPRIAKRVIVLSMDASLCILTVWLAFYLRLDEWVYFGETPSLRPILAAAISLAVALPIFITHGFYRAIFRYSGWPALMTVTRAMAIYGLFYATIILAIGIRGVPRTVGIIQPMLLLLTVGASRAFARYWLGDLYQSQLKLATLPRALIYGAGDAGRQLAAAMANSHEMRIAGFLDDDDRLHGHVLDGQPIYSPADLSDLAAALHINNVLLALPLIDQKRRNQILSKLLDARVFVRTLSNAGSLTQQKISTADLHELDIDDLLGREATRPNHILLGINVTGKIVMVTGAGGSIGSELCRQILCTAPGTLLLIEQSEFALYEIYRELVAKMPSRETFKIVPLLASVRDVERMREIMSTWQPDTIYHAAAYKHLFLVEHNPAESIKNNVLGTMILARTAIEQGVSDFIFISTDQAARPANIMSASKRLAEMVLQALRATSSCTKFAIVRFANVPRSADSLISKFRQQIRDSGPVTLTHPETTRYFLTISDAAKLIIQAGAMAIDDDILNLDMGKPVRIMDLATRIIRFSGMRVKDEANPDGDIAIQILGLRPEERIHEELLIGEKPKPTALSRAVKTCESFLPWPNLEAKLNALELALNVNDLGVIRMMLEQLVSGYNASREIVDWIHLEHETEADARK